MNKAENFVRLNDGHTMPMVGFGTHQMARRITQDLDLFDLELTAEKLQVIRTLDTGRSQFGWW